MSKKKIFVLDTNVLLHDPSCLFRFEENDLFIPMVVLEELDAAKKGTTEIARNARQVSRFLEEMMRDKDHAHIERGLALPAPASPAASCSSRRGRRVPICRATCRATNPTTAS
jgi:PhoH-like ATPase